MTSNPLDPVIAGFFPFCETAQLVTRAALGISRSSCILSGFVVVDGSEDAFLLQVPNFDGSVLTRGHRFGATGTKENNIDLGAVSIEYGQFRLVLSREARDQRQECN